MIGKWRDRASKISKSIRDEPTKTTKTALPGNAEMLAAMPERERVIVQEFVDVFSGQLRPATPTDYGVPFDRWQRQELRKQGDQYRAGELLPDDTDAVCRARVPVVAPVYNRDPETGIRPTAEWGAACRRGFVEKQRSGSLLPQVKPKLKVGDAVTGICGDRYVRLVWRGRWEMLADSADSKILRRRKDFASPYLDHAKRTAVLRFGSAKDWSDEVAV